MCDIDSQGAAIFNIQNILLLEQFGVFLTHSGDGIVETEKIIFSVLSVTTKGNKNKFE